MNTIYSSTCLYTSLQNGGWGGEATDVISMAQEIDLNVLPFGPGGASLPQHSKS